MTIDTLNELIDEYLANDEDGDISPLLQVYDQLADNTKILMPVRSVLQAD